MIKRSLKIASWISLRHPVIVIVGCVILTGISLVLALRLTFPYGLVHLLPRNYPPLQEYLEVSKDFESTPYLIGFIDCKTPRCISTYKELLMGLENRLEGQDSIIDVQMGLTEEGRGVNLEAEVRKNALLYLTPEEIEELKTKLSPSGISVGLSRRQKAGGFFGFLFHPIRSTKLRKDPLDLRKFIRPHIESGIVRNPSFRLSRDGTLFTSLNGRLGFFVAQPTKHTNDIEFDRRLKGQLDKITSESMQEFYERRAPRPRGPKKYLERIYPIFTGTHLTALDDYSVLHSDLSIMMVGALAGILLLFWLAYRRVRYLVYVGVSVVFSVIWTFALARIFFGSLNVITCIMAIPVMGLGVDYAIHLVHRYFLNLGSGLKPDDALATAIESGGRPIVVAGATTAGVFYIMCLATFMGFSQNGFLMGTGIVFNMILVFTLLPAFLTLDAKIGLGSQRIPRATVRPLEWMVRKSLARPKVTVAIASVVLLLMALSASGIRLNPLLSSMYAKGNPSRETFNDFERKINTSMHPVRLLVEARDFEGALETTGLLANVLDRYQDEGKVSFYESLSSLIPPYSQQRRAIEAIKRWPELDPDTFEKNFLSEMNRRRLSPTKLQRSYLPKIREPLSSREIITPASLGQGLSRLLPRYMKTKDGQVMLATYAYPAGRRFAEDIEENFFTDFSKEALYKQGKVRIVGMTQLNLGIKKLVKHDAILVTIIGSVVLIAMIYAFFGRIWPTLMVLIPLVVDFTVALGIFRIAGAELTYASAIWVPMILGIADDYSIYIVDSFERGGGDAAGAVAHEGKPIAITALTTIAAFGAMIFARMGGFVSSGILVCLGVGLAFIISITLLPALLTITSKWGNK